MPFSEYGPLLQCLKKKTLCVSMQKTSGALYRSCDGGGVPSLLLALTIVLVMMSYWCLVM